MDDNRYLRLMQWIVIVGMLCAIVYQLRNILNELKHIPKISIL